MGKHRGPFEFSDQALPGQEVRTDRAEKVGVSRCIEIIQKYKFSIINKAIIVTN